MLLKTIAELQARITVTAAFKFERVQPYVQHTEDRFLLPFLGAATLAELQAAYDGDTLTPEQGILLQAVHAALAPFLMYNAYPHLATQIGNEGIVRSENDKLKSAYRYQITEQRQAFLYQGWDALESLLQLLEDNSASFTTWANDPVSSIFNNQLFRLSAEFSQIVFINSNRLMFHRLQPVLSDAYRNISKQIGAALYNEIITARNAGTLTEQQQNYLSLAQRYAAHKATAEALHVIPISLQPDGAYVLSVVAASSEEGPEKTPAPLPQLNARIHYHNRKAEEANNELIEYYLTLNPPPPVEPTDETEEENHTGFLDLM